MKPGDGCNVGSHCCIWIGEAQGQWWWWHFGRTSSQRSGFLSSVKGLTTPGPAARTLPDELLHIYAALILESSV